jgi:hypothetical protein
MPWPRRRTRLSEVQLQREVDGLRTTICCLRRELETKQGAVSRLETLLQQRLETIDALNGKLEQSRQQVQRLDLENQILVEMIAAPNLDVPMLTQKLDTADLANGAGEG